MELVRALGVAYGYVRPALDIAILAFLIYKVYDLLVKTQAVQIFKGAGLLAGIFGVAWILRLSTLQWVLNLIAPGLVIAVAIVFQPELRKIITRLGFSDIFRPDTKPQLGRNLDPVVTAAEILSAMRRGLLVVFPRKTNIQHIIESGTARLNALITSDLIVAIFQFDGPLHDGAMVIQNGRIAAAGCHLPNSEQQDIKKSFGMRHRAALGMSESTDAVVLVVSEETGAISLAYDGQIYYDLPRRMIEKKLRALLDRSARGGESDDDSIGDDIGDIGEDGGIGDSLAGNDGGRAG